MHTTTTAYFTTTAYSTLLIFGPKSISVPVVSVLCPMEVSECTKNSVPEFACDTVTQLKVFVMMSEMIFFQSLVKTRKTTYQPLVEGEGGYL